MQTILLTGLGAPGTWGTIRMLKMGAESSAEELRIIGIDKSPDVAAKELCDAVEVICTPKEPQYLSALKKICLKYAVDCVLPQTTAETDFLSKFKQSLLPTKILVNDYEAIRVFNNKIETANLFKMLGLGTPKFFQTKSREQFIEACHLIGYPQEPVVVKMPVSNGMRGLRVLRSVPWSFDKFIKEKPSGLDIKLEMMLDLLNSAEFWPELMVSEFINGDEYSVDCYRGVSGEIAIPRKRNLIRTGISFITTLQRNIQMEEDSLKAARHLNLTGVFGFQFMADNAGHKILECNPRVQGTMVASLLSGVNILWASVADTLNISVPPLSSKFDWTGRACFRYWGAVLDCKNADAKIII
jgi:carbamoyl-phosphate synthase large subunit